VVKIPAQPSAAGVAHARIFPSQQNSESDMDAASKKSLAVIHKAEKDSGT